MSFRAIVIGGTGQVGGALIRALVSEPSCSRVVMVNRRKSKDALDPKVRQVVMDTGSAEFESQVTALTKSLEGRVVAASCVGVGAGSNTWTEEQLKALELGVVGAFARGVRAAGVEHFGLLSAVGSNPKSSFKYIRVMGLKEDAVKAIGFKRLALFQPGIIGGNVHTPKVVDWLGKLIPGRFGTVHQDDIGRAFVAEFVKQSEATGVAQYENDAMKTASRDSIG
ncbi:MAG: hypothetical protein ACO1OB_29495 [Archangium sp.]